MFAPLLRERRMAAPRWRGKERSYWMRSRAARALSSLLKRRKASGLRAAGVGAFTARSPGRRHTLEQYSSGSRP